MATINIKANKKPRGKLSAQQRGALERKRRAPGTKRGGGFRLTAGKIKAAKASLPKGGGNRTRSTIESAAMSNAAGRTKNK